VKSVTNTVLGLLAAGLLVGGAAGVALAKNKNPDLPDMSDQDPGHPGYATYYHYPMDTGQTGVSRTPHRERSFASSL